MVKIVDSAMIDIDPKAQFLKLNIWIIGSPF